MSVNSIPLENTINHVTLDACSQAIFINIKLLTYFKDVIRNTTKTSCYSFPSVVVNNLPLHLTHPENERVLYTNDIE